MPTLLQESTEERFRALFGSRRGREERDTILAEEPSQQAEADIHGLSEQEALRELYRHRGLIAEKPLLQELLAELTKKVAGRLLPGILNDSTAYWATSCVKTSYCNTIIVDTDPHGIINIDPASPGEIMHIWPEGQRFIAPYFMPPLAPVQTACGVQLESHKATTVPRGSWAMSRLFKGTGYTRCLDCERHAAKNPECKELQDETGLLRPEEAHFLELIVAEQVEKILPEALAECAVSPMELEGLITDRCRRGLCQVAAKIAVSHGEGMIRAILGSDYITVSHGLWKSYHAPHRQLRLLLSPADWEKFLLAMFMEGKPLFRKGFEQLLAERALAGWKKTNIITKAFHPWWSILIQGVKNGLGMKTPLLDYRFDTESE